ncbi:MAG: nickel-responsive transcriptional regulator NikR [bacterium]
MVNVDRFGVSMERKLLEKFDSLIKEKGYRNRSEAIRDIIRDRLVQEEWKSCKEAVGTVTIVYDHHSKSIAKTLNKLQHQHHKYIISTTHIHMDAHNCLEVLILRGNSHKIKKISDILIGRRGVKHGKLVMTTTGTELL